jgi:hypothetical protein
MEVGQAHRSRFSVQGFIRKHSPERLDPPTGPVGVGLQDRDSVPGIA